MKGIILYSSQYGAARPLKNKRRKTRALIETDGKQADFTDFGALEPIIWEIQRETK